MYDQNENKIGKWREYDIDKFYINSQNKTYEKEYGNG